MTLTRASGWSGSGAFAAEFVPKTGRIRPAMRRTFPPNTGLRPERGRPPPRRRPKASVWRKATPQGSPGPVLWQSELNRPGISAVPRGQHGGSRTRARKITNLVLYQTELHIGFRWVNLTPAPASWPWHTATGSARPHREGSDPSPLGSNPIGLGGRVYARSRESRDSHFAPATGLLPPRNKISRSRNIRKASATSTGRAARSQRPIFSDNNETSQAAPPPRANAAKIVTMPKYSSFRCDPTQTINGSRRWRKTPTKPRCGG